MSDLKVPFTEEMFEDGLRKAVAWVEDMVKGEPIKAFIPTMFMECGGGDPGKIPFGTPLGKVAPKDPQGDRYVIMAMFPDIDMEKRQKYLWAFGNKVGSEGTIVWACYFMVEAWTSSNIDRPELGAKGKYKLPSEDPEHGECISVMGMTIDRRSAVGQVKVTRDKKDKMVLGETSYMGLSEEGKRNTRLRTVLCERFYEGYAIGFLSRNAEKN